MRLMGIEALYPKPRTTRRHPGHKLYPYLLKDLAITRPNQVWAGAAVLCTLSSSWTGTAVKSCLGGYPIPWSRTFVSKRYKKL
jgi:hypothetical protein